jgi:DNA-binding response OmpR family regulator
VLRLEALVRRSWQLPLPRRFQIGGITVDERRSSVETPDGVFVLPRAELKVLSLLVQRMGSVVRRAEFHTVLAGEDGSYSSNALESVLKRIRSQLPALKPRLQTVWGRGYRLAPAGE